MKKLQRILIAIVLTAFLFFTLHITVVQPQLVQLARVRQILNDVWDSANDRLMVTPWAGGQQQPHLFETEITIFNDVWDKVNHQLRTSAGGGGSPSNPDRSIQFNNAGSFGGSSTLLFETTNQISHVLGKTGFGFVGDNTFVLADSGIDHGYLRGTYSANHTAGAFSNLFGLLGEMENNNTGTVTLGAGVAGQYFQSAGGTTTTGAALLGRRANIAAGTLTNPVGLYLEGQENQGTTPYQIRSVGTALSRFDGPVVSTAPAAQTIAAGGIITANACGSMKIISSASAVTTDITNTITAPSADNNGCVMQLCNTGSFTITLDKNANILLAGGVDLALASNCCIVVGNVSAAGPWKQTTAQLCSS